jgi:ATP-dependent DNA ligase
VTLHLFGLTRGLDRSQLGALLPLLERVGPEERAIRSRWQHDTVPPWRRLPAELVCKVRISVIDGGRWLRQPATFVRWRPDRSPEDCGLDQLSEGRKFDAAPAALWRNCGQEASATTAGSGPEANDIRW